MLLQIEVRKTTIAFHTIILKDQNEPELSCPMNQTGIPNERQMNITGNLAPAETPAGNPNHAGCGSEVANPQDRSWRAGDECKHPLH